MGAASVFGLSGVGAGQKSFDLGSEKIITLHDHAINGQDESAFVFEEVSGMGIEDRHLVQITVKAHRSPVASGEAWHMGEMQAVEKRHHLIRLHTITDNGGLSGDDDYLTLIAAYTEQPHIVTKNAVGGYQTPQILTRQCMSQCRAARCGDHREATAPRMSGFEIDIITTLNQVLGPTFDKGAEVA